MREKRTLASLRFQRDFLRRAAKRATRERIAAENRVDRMGMREDAAWDRLSAIRERVRQYGRKA